MRRRARARAATPSEQMNKGVRDYLILGVVVAGSVAAGVFLGSSPQPVGDIWAALLGRNEDAAVRAILSIRLQRVGAAAVTGASLALSGTLFQALLRNPLAEPFLLGVSSGAALGAVAGLTLAGGAAVSGAAAELISGAGVPVLAFVGAAVAIAVVFRVAVSVDGLDTHTLILAGVVVSSFFGAGVMLLLSLARSDSAHAAVMWMMGSFARADTSGIVLTAGCAILVGAVALGVARHLDALALGERAASHLGVNTEGIKRLAYVAASLLAAVSVTVAGVVGFVGLVVPHAVRMVWSAGHRTLIPVSMMVGAAGMVASDALARTALRPLELPVGVITALVGVPFFLYLMRRTRRAGRI